MRDAYRQVVKTYIYRSDTFTGTGFLIYYGILAFCTLLVYLWAATVGFYLVPMWIEIFFFVSLAIHIRDQFSHPQARLIPNFHRAHAVVASLASLIVAILLPMFYTLLAGWQSVGFFAVSICSFGVILWLVILRLTWLSLILWVVIIGMPPTEVMNPLISGKNELGAVLLLVIGIALTVLVNRLLHLDEETLGYYCKNLSIKAAKGESIDQRDENESFFPPSIRLWLSDRQTVGLIRHAQRADTSGWSRVCRWQVVSASGWSVCSQLVGIILFLLIFAWFDKDKGWELWILFTCYSAFAPVLSWQMRYVKEHPP